MLTFGSNELSIDTRLLEILFARLYPRKFRIPKIQEEYTQNKGKVSL